MAKKILEEALTGKIQDELWKQGIKCDAGHCLSWFTDKPIHQKSINIQSKHKHILTEPWMTVLGYKTAEKFLQELREGLIITI
jgi:hypothetical protein